MMRKTLLRKTLRRLLKDEDGDTAIEYGLITSLLAITIIAQVVLMGTALEAIFEGPVAAMDQATVVAADEDAGGEGGEGCVGG